MRAQVAALLHREVAAMNLDNFVVRPRRRIVEQYAKPDQGAYFYSLRGGAGSLENLLDFIMTYAGDMFSWTMGNVEAAYAEMFARDSELLTDCRRLVNRLPLGAAALAGTSFPIDRASWRNIFTSTGAFSRWRRPPVKGGQERSPQETG